MSNMSRNDSGSSLGNVHTFSIFQPALGAALQWFPAIGSRELDDMINAFVPGPFSIQDKRAHVAMDFCEYSQYTGENFKLYSLYGYVPSLSTSSTNSPASSSAMYDSGYGSSFNISPVVSDMLPYTPSVSAATPSPTASDSQAKTRSSATAKSTSSSSRLDLSNHPGMRILTKDGRDITNSAARGAKTKEQRDHAHLMRVIKACDACRRKKTRCDPSHKKRTVSQSSASGAKPAKKARTSCREPQLQVAGSASRNALAGNALTELPTISHNGLSETPDDFWLQFVDLEGGVYTPEEYLPSVSVPAMASPSQFFSQFMPVSATPGATPGASPSPLPLSQQLLDDPKLPYLHQDGSFGTNYLDFNLYSPGSDFLDEEPQLAQKSRVRPGRQPNSQAAFSLFDDLHLHHPSQGDSDGPVLPPNPSNGTLLGVGGGGSSRSSAHSISAHGLQDWEVGIADYPDVHLHPRPHELLCPSHSSIRDLGFQESSSLAQFSPSEYNTNGMPLLADDPPATNLHQLTRSHNPTTGLAMSQRTASMSSLPTQPSSLPSSTHDRLASEDSSGLTDSVTTAGQNFKPAHFFSPNTTTISVDHGSSPLQSQTSTGTRTPSQAYAHVQSQSPAEGGGVFRQPHSTPQGLSVGNAHSPAYLEGPTGALPGVPQRLDGPSSWPSQGNTVAQGSHTTSSLSVRGAEPLGETGSYVPGFYHGGVRSLATPASMMTGMSASSIDGECLLSVRTTQLSMALFRLVCTTVWLSSCLRLVNFISLFSFILLLSLGNHGKRSYQLNYRQVDPITIARNTTPASPNSEVLTVKPIHKVKSKIHGLTGYMERLRCATALPKETLQRSINGLLAVSRRL